MGEFNAPSHPTPWPSHKTGPRRKRTVEGRRGGIGMNGIPERGVEGGKEVGRRRHGWLAVVGEKKGPAPSRPELISPSTPLSILCFERRRS